MRTSLDRVTVAASLMALSLSLLALSGCREASTPAPAAETPPAPAAAGAEPAPTPAPEVAAVDTRPQLWAGRAELSNGRELTFTVRLTPGDAGWQGDVEIGTSAAMPLQELAVEGKVVRFAIAPMGAPSERWARVEVTVADDGAQATGEMRQGDKTFPVTLTRGTRRPAAVSP